MHGSSKKASPSKNINYFIPNFKSISVPGCLANLLLEDKLEISTLEIYDKKDCNLLIELKNPSYDVQAAELATNDYEMDDFEEYENFDTSLINRRVFIIRRTLGLAFAGVLFLIVVR